MLSYELRNNWWDLGDLPYIEKFLMKGYEKCLIEFLAELLEWFLSIGEDEGGSDMIKNKST